MAYELLTFSCGEYLLAEVKKNHQTLKKHCVAKTYFLLKKVDSSIHAVHYSGEAIPSRFQFH